MIGTLEGAVAIARHAASSPIQLGHRAVPDEAPRSSREISQVAQKVSSSSVVGNKNVPGHSRRRRSKSSSIPLSVSDVRISIPEQLTGFPNRPDEAAEPAAISRSGRSSTEISTAAEVEEVTSAPTTVYRTTSDNGRRRKHGRSHAGRSRRESRASISERFGYQILPATPEQGLHNTCRDRASRELPRERPSLPETNVGSEPCTRKPVPNGVTESRLKPIIKTSRSSQLQPTQTSPYLSQTRSSFVDHRGMRTPGKRAATFTRSSCSTPTAETYLEAQTDIEGGGAQSTQDMRSTLLELVEKPAVKNQSFWRSLQALIVEKARQHRRKFISLLFLSTAAGVVLLCLVIVGVVGRIDRDRVNVCGNIDCVDHVTALHLTHNETNPAACEDFASFVCSAVRNRYGALAESVIGQRIMDHTWTTITQLPGSSIFSRPLEMTRKCLYGNADDNPLITLVEFLQDKSFAWPTLNDADSFPDADSNNYSQPLKILFDLAVTWQVPMWFRCHLFLPQKGRRRTLRLSPSSVGYVSKRLYTASKASTSIEDQISIKSYLENVRAVAVDKLASATRIDRITRHSLEHALRDVETVIWPNGSLARPEGLEHYYGPAYNGSGGLFGEIFATVGYMQRFIGTYEGDLVAAIFIPSEDKTVSFYDPVLNSIALSVDAIGPPLYYPSGTSAMIYGGLGFIYSMEVVTALNSMSVLIRDQVSALSAQPLNTSFAGAPSCRNVHLLFPELPALDLAHAAYLRFRDAQSDLPLKGLSYSPEQIFFISFCHTTCLFYANSASFSPRCNEAVKNFAPFSKAFSCPQGSEMNPTTKCHYF
ncbi:hypothetical protein HPB49_023059 [Dermacentor silvarum]|uniref:Uncharacterized protein n=1 Tax=Dermacentor silvarum TaxID=543639 RepID=A0ACB8CN87_DERSI|nr:hypothetical protein HPB49_023059 [Dermacentor silvarum]